MVDIKKKYIILGAVAVLAISFMSFTSAKISQAKEVIKSLIINVSKIRNVRVSLQKISFSFDIILQNPTNEDFSLSSGGAIKAKGYQLVRGDKVLVMGHFSKEFQNIDLPAYQSYTIENVYFELPVMNILSEILNFSGGFKGLFDNISGLLDTSKRELTLKHLQERAPKYLSQCAAVIDLEALGSSYRFKKNLEL